MAVTVNGFKDIDGAKQWVFITLTVDGDSCRYTTVQPWNTSGPVLTGQDLADYCNGREDWFALNILKQMYPGARYQDSTGDTDLEKFTAWISAGHTNAAYCSGAEGEDEETCLTNGGKWIPEEVIEKVDFPASWSINKVNAEEAMKTSVFYKKTPAQLNTYIDNNWTDLTDSKATFKIAVKELRDVILRQGWED